MASSAGPSTLPRKAKAPKEYTIGCEFEFVVAVRYVPPPAGSEKTQTSGKSRFSDEAESVEVASTHYNGEMIEGDMAWGSLGVEKGKGKARSSVSASKSASDGGFAADRVKIALEEDPTLDSRMLKRQADVDEDFIQDEVLNQVEEGLVATCAKCCKLHQFNLRTKQLRTQPYGHWDLNPDESVLPTAAERKALGLSGDWRMGGFELQSRILSTTKRFPTKKTAGCQHEITYAEEIRAVLDRLREVLATFNLTKNRNPSMYVFTNARCGFHVHIGQPGRGKFSVDMAQRITSAVLSCERQMDCLVSHKRITGITFPTLDVDPKKAPTTNTMMPGYEINTEAYNKPLSARFIKHAFDTRSFTDDVSREQYPKVAELRYDLQAWQTLVYKTTDLDGIWHLLQDYEKRYVINLSNLLTNKEAMNKRIRKKDTVEFRQPSGTLFSPQVLAYVDFCIKIIASCDSMSARTFDSLFGSKGDCRSWTFDELNLLEALDCNNDTKAYFKDVHRHSHPLTTYGLDEQLREAKSIAVTEADNANIKALAALVETNLEQQRVDLDPTQMQAMIISKISNGCYGQFEETELDKTLPTGISPAARAKLTIGYVSKPYIETGDAAEASSKKRGRDLKVKPPATMSLSGSQPSGSQQTSGVSSGSGHIGKQAKQLPEQLPRRNK